MVDDGLAPRTDEEKQATEALLKEADRAISAMEIELARLRRATQMYQERRRGTAKSH